MFLIWLFTIAGGIMKLPDINELPEEKPTPQEESKSEPKRIVHRPMTVPLPGESNPKPASFFRRKPKLIPQPKTAPPTQPVPTTDPGPAHRPQAESQFARPLRSSGQGLPPRSDISGKGINPGLKLRALEASGRNAPSPKLPSKHRLLPDRSLVRRAAWDVAAITSLVINIVLAAVLLLMAFQIRNLKSTVEGLLGGLYGNFVDMDNATIATSITVQAQVPVSFDLPVSQNTDVVLTSAVYIPGAHVTINSGALTIDNAPANVTLPIGTSLPIALNMTIPVQTTIPITLQVPVNIPLNQTELHEPFTGLQKTVLPFYCAFNKNAQYPEGIFICK
jgi:hypothetical protein